MSSDASRELLDSLPELKPGETFCFDCNPDVPCFNRCCAELTLPLTPYDVLRLRHNLGLGSEEFLATFTTLRSFPDTGFPLPMLRMLDGPDEPCPFCDARWLLCVRRPPRRLPLLPLGTWHKNVGRGCVRTFFCGARTALPRF